MNIESIEHVLRIIGNIFVFGMLAPLAAFIFVYARWSPWRENELGVALMGQKIALAVMVTAVVAGNFLPEEWDFGRIALRAVLFGAVLFFLIVDVVNLRLMQSEKHHRLFFGNLVYHPRNRRR